LILLPVFFEKDIADPRYLQEHGDLVGEEQLKEAFVITSDPQDLIDVAEMYVEQGFDRILFQSSSPDQEMFCKVMRDDVIFLVT
jgi:coenzyme F420-dependent glucose-6-phosphate dehydrogenase